jgi:hypothetical protein
LCVLAGVCCMLQLIAAVPHLPQHPKVAYTTTLLLGRSGQSPHLPAPSHREPLRVPEEYRRTQPLRRGPVVRPPALRCAALLRINTIGATAAIESPRELCTLKASLWSFRLLLQLRGLACTERGAPSGRACCDCERPPQRGCAFSLGFGAQKPLRGLCGAARPAAREPVSGNAAESLCNATTYKHAEYHSFVPVQHRYSAALRSATAAICCRLCRVSQSALLLRNFGQAQYALIALHVSQRVICHYRCMTGCTTAQTLRRNCRSCWMTRC